MDDFEQRLKRQPLRQLPADWRADILADGRGSKVEGRGRERFELSTFVSRLSIVFWPHPKAWAGLAAVWMVIIGVNISMHEPAPVMAKKASPPSPEVMAELKQQRLMYAQLIGTAEQPADRPKFLPMPRSERAGLLMT